MKKYIVLVYAILTTGCLSSPLLNHTQASPIASPRAVLEAAPTCALSFPQSKLCAQIEWQRFPTEEDTGEFLLRFWSPATSTEHGPYVSPALSVTAKLWMPSMGHGSSPIRVASVRDASGAEIPGVYQATGVFFSMHGAWDLWIQLKNGAQVVEQAKLSLTF